MSELIEQKNNRATVKWQLLASVSALALIANAVTQAKAEDSDRPTVWIELGGQLNRLNDGFEYFVPGFTSMRPANFSPSQKFEKPALYGLDEFGKISLRPGDAGWILSAQIRYGRSSTNRHVRQQSHPSKLKFNFYASLPPSSARYYTKYPRANRFADTSARNTEQHTVVDFAAGKDVGLGLFGTNSSSVVSLGVRFAQFVEKSRISLKSDPDWHFKMKYYTYSGIRAQWPVQPYHSNSADMTANRSFRGLGPSLSWTSTVPFAGNPDEGELDFDWGVNGAILFGRQKSFTQHETTVRYNDGGLGLVFGNGTMVTVYHNAPSPRRRSRSVVVPNIGGFAGLSFRYDTAKVSFGYRGDFFFGAMDGGIDEHKSYGRNFFGPYASISIGLGG